MMSKLAALANLAVLGKYTIDTAQIISKELPDNCGPATATINIARIRNGMLIKASTNRIMISSNQPPINPLVKPSRAPIVSPHKVAEIESTKTICAP
jgi:hypothetical protein